MEAVKGLKLSLLTVVLNAPDDTFGFVYVAFEDGLKSYRVGKDYEAVTAGLPTPTFVVSGNYDIFAKIQTGELSERKALLKGQLHLTGSMLKALRHMRALETVTEVLREIPCKA